MRHDEGNFEGVKGVRLYYQAWIPDRPKAVVQFMHGFSEHSGRLPFLVEALVSNGFALYSKDHRGHGKSDGERTDVENWDDYVEDERKMLDIIKGKSPEMPVFIAGYSMGAVIAGNFALKYENLVKGLVLVAIGSRANVNPLERFLLNILATFKPRGRFWVKLTGETLTSNPEMAQVYETDPLIEHTPSTFRQTRENLRNFETILKHSQGLGLPLLVQCGSDDKVLVQKTPFSQEGLEKMFTMRDKTVKIYQGLFHEVYNEPKEQRDVVLNDLVKWLDNHV